MYNFFILLRERIKTLNITTILTPLCLLLLVKFRPNLTEDNVFTENVSFLRKMTWNIQRLASKNRLPIPRGGSCLMQLPWVGMVGLCGISQTFPACA